MSKLSAVPTTSTKTRFHGESDCVHSMQQRLPSCSESLRIVCLHHRCYVEGGVNCPTATPSVAHPGAATKECDVCSCTSTGISNGYSQPYVGCANHDLDGFFYCWTAVRPSARRQTRRLLLRGCCGAPQARRCLLVSTSALMRRACMRREAACVRMRSEQTLERRAHVTRAAAHSILGAAV